MHQWIIRQGGICLKKARELQNIRTINLKDEDDRKIVILFTSVLVFLFTQNIKLHIFFSLSLNLLLFPHLFFFSFLSVLFLNAPPPAGFRQTTSGLLILFHMLKNGTAWTFRSLKCSLPKVMFFRKTTKIAIFDGWTNNEMIYVDLYSCKILDLSYFIDMLHVESIPYFLMNFVTYSGPFNF